jgi:hypothetical protein
MTKAMQKAFVMAYLKQEAVGQHILSAVHFHWKKKDRKLQATETPKLD